MFRKQHYQQQVRQLSGLA